MGGHEDLQEKNNWKISMICNITNILVANPVSSAQAECDTQHYNLLLYK